MPQSAKAPLKISDPFLASHRRHLRQRWGMVAVGLAICAPLTALSVADSAPVSAPLAALLAAGGYLTYEALDPERASFIHHHRIRLVAMALIAAAAVVGASFAPSPALIPGLACLLILLRHVQTSERLSIKAAGELTALQHKILALEGYRRRWDSALSDDNQREAS